jgi:hypothetical protein
MSDDKQKNSEYRSGEGSVLKTFGITFAILLVPTVCMWLSAVLYSLDWAIINGYGTPRLDNDGVNLGQTIGFYLPIIGIASAIASSCVIVYLVKMRHGATMLTIAVTGIILAVSFNTSISLQNSNGRVIYPGDMQVFLFLIALVGAISLISLWLFIRQMWQRRNP